MHEFQGECADPVLDVTVAETIVHESYVSYSRVQNDDIALIRLHQSVRFTEYFYQFYFILHYFF